MGEADGARDAAAPAPDARAALGWRRTLWIALGAGVLGGAVAGVVESTALVLLSEGDFKIGVLGAAAAFYALNGALYAPPLALLGWALARGRGRPLRDANALHGAITAAIIGLGAFATAVYWISLDVFEERVELLSMGGLALLGGCGVVALALTAGLAWLLRRPLGGRHGGRLRGPIGGLLVLTIVTVLVRLPSAFVGETEAEAPPPSERPPARPDAPNVILVIVDTWRADHLPSYGYAEGSTPALDRFAQDAVRFSRFYTNSSWTRPSFATLYTGRYPSSHRTELKTDALPDEVTTLAEVLREQGYATTGFVTNYNSGPHFNYDQGFDRYEFLAPDVVIGTEHGLGVRLQTETLSAVLGTDVIALIELLPLRAYQRVFSAMGTAGDDVSPGTAYHDAETLNRRVFEFLDEPAVEGPLFLTVGYMDPHHPFYRHPYDGRGFTRAAHEEPELSDAPRMRALYDGEIRYWDTHFGAFIERLREEGLYEDSLIIVTSDHGEEFGEHGGFYHGTTVYEEVTHVPLFVKLPGGRRAGTVVGHWVEAVDLFPSILHEVGAPIPEAVQGNLLDEGSSRIITEENHEGHRLASIRTERDGRRWLLTTANPDNPRQLPERELFDVDADPMQQQDLAARFPDIAEELLAELVEAREVLAEGGAARNAVELSPVDRQRLCELGYLVCDDG